MLANNFANCRVQCRHMQASCPSVRQARLDSREYWLRKTLLEAQGLVARAFSSPQLPWHLTPYPWALGSAGDGSVVLELAQFPL